MASKSKEAMLREDDIDVVKTKPVDRSPLDPDWLTRKPTGKGDYWDEPDMEKKRSWEKDRRAWGPAFGHLLYALLLISEIGLWCQVMHLWRYSPSASGFFLICIPVVLPSLLLPALSVCHSLTRGRLSMKEGLLLICPPSPLVLHLILIYRSLARRERERWSRSARVAGMVQACVMSFPLLITSFKTFMLAIVANDSVDTGLFHRQLYENKFLFAGTIISFFNLIVASYRFNERETGRPVSVLVGLPFLVSNILFRIIGFGLLFSLFEDVWIALCLAIMFGMSALSVQLSSNLTICGRLFRLLFGDDEDGTTEKRSSIFSSLLLSIGGVILPMGYTRDLKLGHVSGRGWRLILVNAIGSLAILSTVISQSIVQHIPNSFSGQSLVDMILDMAAMEVTIKTGGKELTMDIPKTQISVMAESPARASFTVSHHDDIILSYMIPAILAVLCLPFTVLRIILLGWDCRLQKKIDEDDIYQERRRTASHGRSCCAVLWSVWSLMSFTSLFSMLLGSLVFCAILTHVKPIG